MSLHYGIASIIDEMRAIIIGEKEAWKGSITDYTELQISKGDLFGGIKKEGGAEGIAAYLPGNASQIMPEYLANKLGLTADTCPAYRGISSLWFSGGPNTSQGFYWAANSPRIPPVWLVCRRAPKGLDPTKAMIDGNDANPAHVIYELLVNKDWGVGALASGINTDSFQACGNVLFDENFGISLLWTAQQKAEDFISNILTYVDGVVYLNPRDGKITMRLIRNDYDPDTLKILNPENTELSEFQRKLWGETINEIVVSWTNPESEETETVSVQDLANIAVQGGVISDNNPYEGIRNSTLAMEVATRDLRVASAPLASCSALVNRKGWDIVPGDCVKVTWPRHGMVEVIMRVGNVDYGRIGDSKIKVALIEDVFSLDTQDYVTPPTTGWINTREQPAPLVYSLVFTLPYFFARTFGDESTMASLSLPQVLAGVLGAQPGRDTQEFILASETSDTLGNPLVEYGTSVSTTTRGLLADPLVFEVESFVEVVGLTQGDGMHPGMFAILGTDDDNMEVCLVKTTTGGACTLIRGVLDTIPKAWPIDTPIWFVATDTVIDDEEVHTAGSEVEYRPLTVTSMGTLAWEDASPITGQLSLRPWLPSRPANVKINAVPLGTVDAIDSPSVTVTWANRNRTMEDVVVLDWDDATVIPEVGQTTSILILHPTTRAIANRVDGLTGDSYELTAGEFAGLGSAIVKVIAVRDGLDSLQGHEIKVLIAGGYGFAYGYNYGN
jgi:hypothetical protein